MDSSAIWVIPVAILTVVIVGFVMLRLVMSCRKTTPPNQVAVVFGRKNKDGERGYRIIKGGGFFKIPILEDVMYLSLNVMTFPIEVQNVPDSNGVLISVKGVANVKVNSADEFIGMAIERFLGMSPEEIQTVARENLEGNLRALVGTLPVEDLIKDRASFQTKVLNEAGSDMSKLGLVIDLLNIKDITDKNQYIESLGRKQTADIIRNATIGEAQAKRDSDISSAQARQAGAIATTSSEQEISNAERQRDEIIAQNQAVVDAAKARVPLVAQAAAAEEQKALNVANVAAEQAREEAQINLQDAVRRRTEAELNATTIVNATKTREASIITAEGNKQARVIAATAEQEAATLEGEASRIRAEKEGKGEQAKMTAQAEGRIEQAKAVQAEKEAEAAGTKALLLAQAEGTKAGLLATAEGTKAGLLAEAEGILKKAEAFAKLDDSGRFLLILEQLPPVIAALGEAAAKVIVPAAEAIGEGLGNVDEIRLIDLGGGKGVNGEGNVLSQFMASPPHAIFKLVEQLKASKLLPVLKPMLAKAGIDLDEIMKGMKTDVGSEVAPASAPALAAGDTSPAVAPGKK